MRVIQWGRVLPFFLLTAAMTLNANHGFAEENNPNENKGDWDFELGAVGGVTPEYEGSDSYEPLAAPYFHLSWKDTVVATTRGGGPGLYLQKNWFDDFSTKLGVRYEGGRDQDDSDALEGLGDLDVGAVAVGGIAYEWGPVEFSAELAHDLTGDRDGTTATLGAEYSAMAFENRGRFAIGPTVTWADEEYMDNSFGISNAQAASSRNNYSPFDAESGIKDVGLNASFSYAVTEHVSVLVSGEYARLLGDAADSPLVDDEGNANQFQGLLGLIYRW